MSDFQLALVGIAIAFVVAVVLYNRWQESKYKRRAERAFSGDQPDVLVDSVAPNAHETERARSRGRVEPMLGGAAALAGGEATRPTSAALAAGDDMEGLTPIGEIEMPVQHAPALVGVMALSAVNPETDSVALILADAPIEANRYHEAIAHSQQIGRGVNWEGMVEGQWRPIPDYDSASYREMRAGIQLSDRRGPIAVGTLTAFSDSVAQFAASVNAVSQREDVNQALARAATVDEFCADTDIEIGINVIGKNGATFPITKLRGLAEAQGMVALDTGEYVMRDELGRLLYTLRNMDVTQPPGIKNTGAVSGYLGGITFVLDLPRTERPVKVFENMTTFAIKFADVLHGDVVDDNKRVLTANGRKAIAETIATITAQMISKGVEPGSAIALRLYS